MITRLAAIALIALALLLPGAATASAYTYNNQPYTCTRTIYNDFQAGKPQTFHMNFDYSHVSGFPWTGTYIVTACTPNP